MTSIAPTPGTYTVFNALSYTSQLIVITNTDAQVYTAPTAHYPASLLGSASLADVAAILEHGRTVVYSFVAEAVVEVAAAIGNARASELHRVMGKVGIPHGEHYAFSRAATGDHSIYSLAVLTGEQADAVWAYLCFCYPAAASQAVAA